MGKKASKKLAQILKEEGLLRLAAVNVSILPSGIASWYKANEDFIDEHGSLVNFSAKKSSWSSRYFEAQGWSDTVYKVPVINFEVNSPRGSAGSFEITWYPEDLKTKKKPFHVAESEKLRLHQFDDVTEAQIVKALNAGIKKAEAILARAGDKISIQPKYRVIDEYRYKEENQYWIFNGVKKVGEVWKGMDGWWHTNNYRAGEGYRFRKRKDAVSSFIDTALASTLGKPAPAWE